ncbi:adenine deaminase [Paenibacillus aestuarii]|uniref:Adenine deaminase n=1 Tax=Paenibacillus aestuarii TaxID=516965 RepID=A0ABW0K6F9_9BACL|nr:adenine deaminase [Paenibacillus aestuarii]
MLLDAYKRRIAVASGKEPADTVITNGKIIDVFNGEIIEGDIAIADGIIVGIGAYSGHAVVDAGGKYVAPAFIDGHVHIESAMLTPAEFAKVLLPHGVTSIVADPHEVANVMGTKGIQYMLDASEGVPFDFYFMLPSCVPATDFEHAGARLEIADLAPFYEHPRVIGLAEVMNYPAVLNGEESMVNKLAETLRQGAKIDGHAAGLSAMDLNVYLTAGIRTDHEAVTVEEAKQRLQRGMYLMIREGTVAKDLEALIPAVTPHNARRCLFVTDDKLLDDLLQEGNVDHNIRLAISRGVPPITAIQMASLNTAECFGFTQKGAIAPGYQADMLFIDELEALSITHVFKDGRLVAERGELVDFPAAASFHAASAAADLTQTVRFADITVQDLHMPLTSSKAHVIGIKPNSLITEPLVEEVDNTGGQFRPSVEQDLLKLAVIERHHHTGNIGLAIVHGFGLKKGAIASTVAHDSHNVIIAGTNDEDMVAAANKLKEMQGGLVVIADGQVLAALPLPIAGLIANSPYQDVYDGLKQLDTALQQIGARDDFNPFLMLSFLALPVIPALKLTDLGLFDVTRFQHILLEAE